ncbi:MAG: hypothetical protein GF353_08205 [Candidatus Lokiarchaeota archaeon]|nr:hypothetical protein [Candidatus Lokiarchaeota archaeon]
MSLKNRRLFIRNIEAADYLENFLVSAVAAVLLIRFYLELTGYPKIATEKLHIAHMLWGGLLMLIAIIILLSFLSKSSQRLAAIVGGVGFGAFIDELGKFITRDNDYFYQPTIALIYVIFVLIIIGIRTIHRGRTYSSEEYIMNGLREMEEVALHDLDKEEKQRALAYLKKGDPEAPLAKAFRNLLETTELVPTPRPGILTRTKRTSQELYQKIAHLPGFPLAIIIFFLFQLLTKLAYAFVLIFFKGLGFEQIVNIQILNRMVERFEDLTFLQSMELGSSLLSGIFVMLGIFSIHRSRLTAFKMFERSILISIFLTQVFIFYRDQFAALIGLSFNLLVFAALRYVIRREEAGEE